MICSEVRATTLRPRLQHDDGFPLLLIPPDRQYKDTLVLSHGAATPTRSTLARLRPMPLQLLKMKKGDQHLTTNNGSLAQPYNQDEEMKLLGLCSAQI